jgi:hypothetical protein
MLDSAGVAVTGARILRGLTDLEVVAVDDLGDAIRAGFATDGPTLVELTMVIDPPWDV